MRVRSLQEVAPMVVFLRGEMGSLTVVVHASADVTNVHRIISDQFFHSFTSSL
jgi:hypothetical protein